MIREFNYYFYKSRLLLVAIGILLFSGNVIANDGGFVGYGDGSTVIPVNNNHIEMLAEEVVCSINDGYADFVCVFYFLNTSTKPQEVLMGFPITIDFLVEGPDGAPYDWESGIFFHQLYGDAEDLSNIMSNIKSNRDFLVKLRKDIEKHYRFRAFVDGVEVPTEFKYINLKYLDGNEEYGNVAFLWKVKFEPREAKVITNIYRQPLDEEGSANYSDYRYYNGVVASWSWNISSFYLQYITLTGKLWKGGKIGRAKFRFDIPIDYRNFVIGHFGAATRGYIDRELFLYLSGNDFYPIFVSSPDVIERTKVIPNGNRTILEIDIMNYVPTANIGIILRSTCNLGEEIFGLSNVISSILKDDNLFDDFYNYYLSWCYDVFYSILSRLDLYLKFSESNFKILSRNKSSPLTEEEFDKVWFVRRKMSVDKDVKELISLGLIDESESKDENLRMKEFSPILFDYFSYEEELYSRIIHLNFYIDYGKQNGIRVVENHPLIQVSRVIRNAFYARKGYMFKDNELKSYFESYGLKLTNKNVSLTEEEENRILLISLIEDIGKCCEVYGENVYTALNNVIEKVDTMNMLYMKISNLLSKGITNDIVKVGMDICDNIMLILKSERKNIELFSKKLKIKISKEFEERLKELEKERERLLKEKEELEKGVGGIVNKLTGELEKKQKRIYELENEISSLRYKSDVYKRWILENCDKLLLGIDNFFRKVNIPMQR